MIGHPACASLSPHLMPGIERYLAAPLTVLLTFAATTAWARQTPCRAVMPSVSTDANIFTPAQERDLGDAIAERAQRDYQVIDDASVRAFLESIGTRLTAHLPAGTDLTLMFHVIELPEPNAFVLPGGRVYVSRKLIAFARSEDELAGVIAHEIGHLLARQLPAQVTRLFKDVLNVTAVTDRQDVQEKYKQFVDTLTRNPRVTRTTSKDYEADQADADSLGLFLVSAAGYDSEAFVTFFERLLALNDRRSNFFSDLFGKTAPDIKRLRLMTRTQAKATASCATAGDTRPVAAFEQWQADVIAYTGRGTTETLTGVISRTTLTPPLQSNLISLRFSPDGQYILAEDAANITVLTREPFRVVFSFDAPSSRQPKFSPDSRQVVFHTPDLRVQTWDITEKRLRTARDVAVPGGCTVSDVSADGRFLACLDAANGLALYDVDTSERILDRKAFFKRRVVVDGYYGNTATISSGFNMEFSPDARYFVAGFHDEGIFQAGVSDINEVVAYDLSAKALVELTSNTKKLLAGGFTFAGANRLLALNFETPVKSSLITLPSGAVERTLLLSRGRFDGATAGPYAVYRPFQKYAAAVFDFDKGAFVMRGAYEAVDLYRDVFVAERSSGELALYAVDGMRVLATTALPSNTLGQLEAAKVSADLTRVAISGESRGALWDLTTGRGIAGLPAFAGGHFAADRQLYIDVQPLLGFTRQMARVEPRSGELSPVGDIADGTGRVFQVGAGVLSLRPAQPESRTSRAMLLEMRDATSLASLWSQTFPNGLPRVRTDVGDGHVLYLWPTVPADVRARLKDSPALKKTQGVESGNAYLVEISAVRTGQVRGAVVVDAPPGSFSSAYVIDDDLVVNGTDNRVVAYSIATGNIKGQVFGRAIAVSPRQDLILVQNGSGRTVLYDYPSLQRRAEFNFRRGVAVAAFSEDSSRLLALTFDQSAVVIAVPEARQTSPSATAK